MLASASVLVSGLDVLVEILLSDGQGTVRRAVLFADRFC